MLELINGFSKLSILLEQYQNSERAVNESTIQQEALFRMPGEYSRDLEQAKSSTGKAIKISKASRDAYVKVIEQLTGHTPEELYNLLPQLSAAIEAAQRCIQQEAELRATYEILATANSFEEDSPRNKFEEKLKLMGIERDSAELIARTKLRECNQGSGIVVVSESQASNLLVS